MIWAFLSLAVYLGLLGLITHFAYREQGRRYEQLIRILETDRDAARTEAKTYRNLLFPVMAKTDVMQQDKVIQVFMQNPACGLLIQHSRSVR